MELSEDEIIENMENIEVIASKILFFHMNMIGLVFHVVTM